MPKTTVEVRWFFPSPPMSCEAFFGSAVPTIERTDWYAFPCHPFNGVKFREGRLETKLLIRNDGPQRWGDVSGVVESWSKWSAEYTGDLPDEGVLRRSGWIAVQKRRHWRVLKISSKGCRWQAMRAENGCEIELSVVKVDGTQWWTVGFEAVGKPSRLHDNLERAIKHVLDGQTSSADLFSSANSFAYPSWLRHLDNNGSDLPTR